MRQFAVAVVLTLALALTLTACGGGGSGGSAAPAVITLSAGQSVVLQAGQTAYTPAGSTIQSNGSQITLAGDHNTVNVAAGATIQVPTTALGAADNIVTTDTASAGPVAGTLARVERLAGSANNNANPIDGTGSAAVFWGGGQIVVNARGDLIVSDRGALRQVTQAGVVTTLANGIAGPIEYQALAIDARDRLFVAGTLPAASGSFFQIALAERPASGPTVVLASGWETGNFNSGFGGLAVDAAGNVYFADAASNQIFKLAPGGTATLFAGSGEVGSSDGNGAAASFHITANSSLPIDAQGNLYLLSGFAVRKISPQGAVTTLVSNVPFGVVDGSGGGVLARDASGNLYTGVSATLYRITPGGVITSYATLGSRDFITALATDANGVLYAGTRGGGAEIFRVTPP